MKTPLLVFVLLLAMCSPPEKTYTKPEIGIEYVSAFRDLCGLSPNDTKVLTTESGDTLTVINKETDYKGDTRPAGCVGTFTFVNNKLVSIEH